MSGPLQYTPYLWPLAISSFLLIALALYSFQNRHVAGALPFAFATAFSALWAIGLALELASVTDTDKLFWVKFQTIWLLPIVTVIQWFALEYANPHRKLSLKALAWLAIPPILLALFVLTNDIHHLLWKQVTLEQNVNTVHSYVGWIFIAYAYFLALWTMVVLVRYFVRSPLHRWPIALVLGGLIVNRTAFLIEVTSPGPNTPFDLLLPSTIISSIAYSVALFRFGMFDPIPMARDKAVEQMREGMLVVDSAGQIIDLNPEAERFLQRPASEIRGQALASLIPRSTSLEGTFEGTGIAHSEASIQVDGATRHYELMLSPFRNSQGQLLGHLLLFHDMTDQKQIQTKIVEQQRVLATMQERERLARELHDSAGQVLGYVSLQAQAIRKHVRDGNTDAAENQLTRLAETASAAHTDIRESILGLKAGAGPPLPFVAGLRQYLDAYDEHFGIRAVLGLADGLEGDDFAPATSAQLMRVIGEALTNARKHSHASRISVNLAREDGYAHIVIADDGRGFDMNHKTAGDNHFGLAFMRERMAQVGGTLEIDSMPGEGTRVSLRVPIATDREAGDERIAGG